MSLERFKTAQASAESGFAPALAELEAGRKTSHWIWYVFPQHAELGRSSTAKFYGLQDLVEARDYLSDETLGERLRRVTAVVHAQLKAGARLDHLMGGTIDALKIVSSLTLFRSVARARQEFAGFVMQCDEILAIAERQGFPPCTVTLAQTGS